MKGKKKMAVMIIAFTVACLAAPIMDNFKIPGRGGILLGLFVVYLFCHGQDLKGLAGETRTS